MGNENDITLERDGWSVALSRYRSDEFGEAVGCTVSSPSGESLHTPSCTCEFSEEGALGMIEIGRRLMGALDSGENRG